MKMLLPILFMISSVSAGEILGSQVLKGSIDTKVEVKTIKVKCSLEVEKVKNMMEEDSFGNPAYKVRVAVALNGENDKKKIKVKFKKEFQMVNLFLEGSTSEVKDFDYRATEGVAGMRIDEAGRIKSFNFIFEEENVNCHF